MYQGIIIDVKKHHSVVLSEGTYYKIYNKKEMREGMNILFTNKDKIDGADSKTRVVSMFRYASVAAALVVVLMMSLMYYNNNLSVFSVVTMDINPSVEVSLNAKNEVLSVQAMNEDGKSLLDIDVNGLLVDEAIALLVAQAKDKGFVKNDGEAFIVVTAVPIKDKEDSIHIEEIQALIEARVDQHPLLREVTVAILEATEAELETAKEIDIPLPVIVMKSNGKAKKVKTVKEIQNDPELMQVMEQKGNILGNSLQHRNDIQVIFEKLSVLDEDAAEAFLKDVDLNDLTKEELRELKENGKLMLAELKPNKEDKEDKEEDEEDEYYSAYDEGALRVIISKLEAILETQEVDNEGDIQEYLLRARDAIDGDKEDDKVLQEEGRLLLKALRKAGVKMKEDMPDSNDVDHGKEGKPKDVGQNNQGVGKKDSSD